MADQPTLDLDSQLFAKLEANTERRDPEECWPWLGYVAPNGYGWVNIGSGERRRSITAHRLALIASGVPITDGYDACHKCDNRACVNPAHLYAGTRRENMADCTRRGRHNKPRGENHWRAKLSAADVAEIRERRNTGETVTALAARFGVHHSTVSRIARGVWRQEVTA